MLDKHSSTVFTKLLPTVHFYNKTLVSKRVVTKQAMHIPFACHAPQNTAGNSEPRPCDWPGAYLPFSHRTGPVSEYTWDLWWKRWQLDRFTSEFSCPMRGIIPKMFPTNSNIIWWGDEPFRGHSSTLTQSHCNTKMKRTLALLRRR
jgi:hypothetical protein